MLIEKENVAELLPADYNPRKEPVIWNATTGRVVGGISA